MFANTDTSVQIAESGTFFANRLRFDCGDALIGSICADLGLDATGPVDIYVGKRNVEGGPRRSDIESNNFRVAVGSEGQINANWSYDASFTYGTNSSNEANVNDFITTRLEDALLQCPAGSSSSCVPYNVWVPGGVTPEAAAGLGGTGMRQGSTALYSAQGYVTGDTGFALPAAQDNISAVFGAEYRDYRYEVRSDTNMAEGNFTGLGGPRPPIDGGYDVHEIFAEVGVPLVQDAPFAQNLALDLGIRYSNYNTAGDATSYKIGASWQPTDEIRVRGGYNRAIRAPNVGELFSEQQISLWGGEDPCAGATPTFTLAQCQNTGVTAAQYGSITASPAAQYNQFSGGNPNLEPEQADTWTLGVVATPLSNLSVSLDYYNIELTDRIGSIGAGTILRFCGLTGDPFLCDKVNRNASTGDLWLGSSLATSGYIENLSDNFGDLTWSGIDLVVNYGFDALGGSFSTSFNGSYALEREIAPLPGVNEDATYDCAGLINGSCQTPEWRHTARVSYTQDTWWDVSVRWRRVGELDYTETDGTAGSTDLLLVNNGNKLDAFDYFDVTGTLDLTDNAYLVVGVNNVLDEEPPLVGSTLALNGNAPGGYDQIGRFLHATINVNF